MITSQPDSTGHFGPYGGRFVPEVLMAPLEELELAYRKAAADPAFQAELDDLLHNYAGRPTPLYYAKRLSESLGGAKIYLKREDLLHTGAHKINNCLGQASARAAHGQKAHHRGDRRGAARRGDGHRVRAVRSRMHRLHGRGGHAAPAPRTSSACVCWGRKWWASRPAAARSKTRSARRCATGSPTSISTYYLLGSALGAHPYPLMVRDFHRVIGVEAREQILKREGRLPDALIRLRRRRQ